MKRLSVFLLLFTIAIGFGLFVHLTNEYDPAYRPHVTTFDGQDAFGCLHRDGTYTFYRAQLTSAGLIMHGEIATFPSGEAAKLH